MANFELTNLAAKMLYPGNVVQTDDAGLPSILVYIPKFKNSDVLNCNDDSTHPAFIVNGKEIPGFYYSKYQNVVYNGVAYSLPGEDPHSGIHFDNALTCCEAKGLGWHLSTNAEWAAIALWCKKNGFLPYGNNDYGKDINESGYKAVPASYGSDGKINRVATGTGPLSWSHDGTPAGIWDMNGNTWEWQGGVRIVRGELQILPNNDAADLDNPQNATSTCWKAINASTGALVEPECKTTDTEVITSGDTVKLDIRNNVLTYSSSVTNPINANSGCYYRAITFDDTIGEVSKVLLRALALLPDVGDDGGIYQNDFFYFNNGSKEVSLFRGGSFSNGAVAGMFGANLNNSRVGKGANMSFRAAYIPDLPTT